MAHNRFSTRKLAFGGIVAALSLAVLFLSGVFPFAEYAIPAVAGIFLVALVIDFGRGAAWLCYGVIALLGLILLPNKEAALAHACFLGYYPILKSVLERIPNRALEWVCKLAVFNAAVVAAFVLLVYAFGMSELPKDLALPGNLSLPVTLGILLVAANAVFLLYDSALSGLIRLYLQRIRPKLRLGK